MGFLQLVRIFFFNVSSTTEAKFMRFKGWTRNTPQKEIQDSFLHIWTSYNLFPLTVTQHPFDFHFPPPPKFFQIPSQNSSPIYFSEDAI